MSQDTSLATRSPKNKTQGANTGIQMSERPSSHTPSRTSPSTTQLQIWPKIPVSLPKTEAAFPHGLRRLRTPLRRVITSIGCDAYDALILGKISTTVYDGYDVLLPSYDRRATEFHVLQCLSTHYDVLSLPYDRRSNIAVVMCGRIQQRFLNMLKNFYDGCDVLRRPSGLLPS
mgnify:CR=1 FL=1